MHKTLEITLNRQHKHATTYSTQIHFRFKLVTNPHRNKS